jgi:hypothetical protein
VCGADCLGIRKIDETVTTDGREVTIHASFMGAEGRYEDYIYLQMLQREWERPVAEFELFSHFANAERPSGRAALVLLFWGYFETRIERLHRAAMRKLPQRVLDDELRRYSGIGSRLYDPGYSLERTISMIFGRKALQELPIY